MANFPWPRSPADSLLARMLLVGGPFDGEGAAFVPPDTAAPAQIVWGGWFPWGFSAYLYEWHGEKTMDRGRTDALIYRPPIWQSETLRVGRGRRLTADEIPPVVSEDADVWASSCAMIVEGFDVPAELIWPGL